MKGTQYVIKVNDFYVSEIGGGQIIYSGNASFLDGVSTVMLTNSMEKAKKFGYKPRRLTEALNGTLYKVTTITEMQKEEDE